MSNQFPVETTKKQKVSFSTENSKDEAIITGKIDFASSRDERIVPFMVVPKSVEIKRVFSKIITTWKLTIPRIVLMIISDPSHRFAWKDKKAIDAFVTGLVKAMNATEMWILTDGLNVGISREIAEGFRTEMGKRVTRTCTTHHIHKAQCPDVSLIGVCSHDFVSYGHTFLKSERPIKIANGRYIRSEGTYDLNPSHSHFIIIKDNSRKGLGVRKFLREMAQEMAHSVEYRSQLSTSVPESVSYRATDVQVITVVLQGDENALDFALDHLKSGLPVVVINGSGGVADLLACTFYEIERMPDGSSFAEYAEKVLKPMLCEKGAKMFSSLRSSRLAQTYFYEKMLQCVRFGNTQELKYLSILDTNELKCKLEDLPSHLLNALFKCRKSKKRGSLQIRNDLFMAMDWNCPDIALDEIFKKTRDTSCKIGKEHFVKALMKPNREGFVELFLGQGFQVHKFLTSNQLIVLFRKSVKEDFFGSVIWEGLLGYLPGSEVTKEFIDTKLISLVEDFSGISSFFSSEELDKNFHADYSASERQEAEQKSIAVLVVWAVLSYRINLVKALWKRAEQPICLALFISMLLKKLCTLSFLDPILKTEIKNHYKAYASLATDILDSCFKDFPSKAYEVVSEKNPVYAYQNMMEMAAFVQNKTLLAHPCCQKWLDNAFMGNIRFKDCEDMVNTPQWLKIVLSAFLFIPMYRWISFHIPVGKFADLDVGNRKSNEKYRGKCPNLGMNFPMKRPVIVNQQYMDLIRKRAHNTFPQFTEIHPNILHKIYYMWTAPITKFWTFELTYFMYLALMSLSVLWPSCGNRNLDTSVCIWTSLILTDCIYNTYQLKKKYRSLPIGWRCLEIFIIGTLFCSYLMGRVISYTLYLEPYTTKVLICLGLLFFYYRIIFISLPISSKLGPLLYRVKRMVVLDFVNFMRIALLLMISNGIVLQAVLYPDLSVSEILFRKIFQRIWIYLFKVPTTDFGKINEKCIRYISRPHDPGLCRAGKYLDPSCPNVGLWPYIFIMQYLILLKFILLTMLYALFSVTQKKLQEESDFIWKFQRYQLVVEFSERVLPPPLSVLSYAMILIKSFKNYLSVKHKHSNADTEPVESFLSSDFGYIKYWSNLSTKYCSEIEGKVGAFDFCKEMDYMDSLKNRLRLQKEMITELESRISELQVELNYTQKQLEKNRFHSAESDYADEKANVPQRLSRLSPYPNTKVQRFPVPNNRVPWNILWAIYDPVAYTLPKEDFRSSVQSFVDDDAHLWLETRREDSSRPVFHWNQVSQSPAGIYVNRQSWMTDSAGKGLNYEIDLEGLPRNPMGRTGIRGKGSLPRWGPNHLAHVLITRQSALTTLEFVVCKTTTVTGKEKIALPGGFVTTHVIYDVIAGSFESHKDTPVNLKWQDARGMIDFFNSCAVLESRTGQSASADNVLSNLVVKGYMDDPLNTDQAWFELELWHVHYNGSENLERYFIPGIQWQALNEKILCQMCEGITQYIKCAIAGMELVL